MAEKPNILILLSDQLRRHALSCYGDPNLKTPNIDALAAGGVRFDAACSTYPVCVPFRYTLMTGEPAHARLIPAIEWAMSPRERTLADEFNDAGYETVYIGKWHLDGGHGRMGSPLQCGRTPVRRVNQGRWQKWYGFELRNSPFDTYYFEDDDPTPRKIEGYQTDGLYDIGMNHLREKRDTTKPFCMVISVEPPHTPFEAPSDLQTAWESREIELPANFSADPEKQGQLLLDRKRYYAMVENLDRNVGRMTDFLNRQGLARDTEVLFFSDHGELNGAHGLTAKQWPYEESVGIPLIVGRADRSEGGRVVPDPVNTEDLFPTILGLAGITPARDVPGTNLTPLIEKRQERLDRPGVPLEFVAEHRHQMVFHDEVWRAFRSERYKYTVKGNKFGAKPWQFFDLLNDPWEMTNLIDEESRQREVRQHHRWLVDHLRQADDPFVLLPAYDCEGVNGWD